MAQNSNTDFFHGGGNKDFINDMIPNLPPNAAGPAADLADTVSSISDKQIFLICFSILLASLMTATIIYAHKKYGKSEKGMTRQISKIIDCSERAMEELRSIDVSPDRTNKKGNFVKIDGELRKVTAVTHGVIESLVTKDASKFSDDDILEIVRRGKKEIEKVTKSNYNMTEEEIKIYMDNYCKQESKIESIANKNNLQKYMRSNQGYKYIDVDAYIKDVCAKNNVQEFSPRTLVENAVSKIRNIFSSNKGAKKPSLDRSDFANERNYGSQKDGESNNEEDGPSKGR